MTTPDRSAEPTAVVDVWIGANAEMLYSVGSDPAMVLERARENVRREAEELARYEHEQHAPDMWSYPTFEETRAAIEAENTAELGVWRFRGPRLLLEALMGSHLGATRVDLVRGGAILRAFEAGADLDAARAAADAAKAEWYRARPSEAPAAQPEPAPQPEPTEEPWPTANDLKHLRSGDRLVHAFALMRLEDTEPELVEQVRRLVLEAAERAVASRPTGE